MIATGIIAKAKTNIHAPAYKVWDALVNPVIIKKYMFGATVVSDWEEGSEIKWKGQWKGKDYEDKGVILQINPESKLQYTHYSRLSGEEDIPENYHRVTIELVEMEGQTMVTLTQDNNDTDGAREHSEKNWKMMLEGLKKTVEEDQE